MVLLSVPSAILFAGVQEDRAEAFCQWISGKPAYKSDTSTEYCATKSAKESDRLNDEIEGMLIFWTRVDGDALRRMEFDAYWKAWSSKRAAGVAKKREAERQATFLANIRTVSADHLCGEVRRKGGLPEALQEIVRRKMFSAADLSLIAAHQIKLGMTEGAMICSWGKPSKVNRSVGSYGEHKQNIYGDTYVYTENGKVTSYQD